MTIYGIVMGGMLGCVIGTFLISYRTTMEWRMSLRREAILSAMFAGIVEVIHDPETRREEVGELVTVGAVKLADEIANQQRVKPWRRVPEVGTSWPDFQPSEIKFLGDDES